MTNEELNEWAHSLKVGDMVRLSSWKADYPAKVGKVTPKTVVVEGRVFHKERRTCNGGGWTVWEISPLKTKEDGK